MYKRLITTASLLAAAMLATNAQALEFGKPIKTYIVTNNSGSPLNAAAEGRKEITLMNIQLTQREKDILFNSKSTDAFKHAVTPTQFPAAVNLGMNDTPVLDQGAHGSCVTFATTAAIDAVLGRGNYISQLCNLELGAFLENDGYYPSGWEGTWGPAILDQMMRFGMVSMTNQRTGACGSLTEYPVNNEDKTGRPLPLKNFKQISEPVDAYMYWTPLLSALERFDARFANNNDVDVAFDHMKAALNQGHRVTFGTILVLSPYCSVGACASYKAKDDTWALTREIETPPYMTGGHEMVIMGYDDNASVVDKQGKRHTGLLLLRNSWGVNAGDQGNYYMTYDYFKKFVMEIQEIAPIFSLD